MIGLPLSTGGSVSVFVLLLIAIFQSLCKLLVWDGNASHDDRMLICLRKIINQECWPMDLNAAVDEQQLVEMCFPGEEVADCGAADILLSNDVTAMV